MHINFILMTGIFRFWRLSNGKAGILQHRGFTAGAPVHMLLHCSWQPTGEDQTIVCNAGFVIVYNALFVMQSEAAPNGSPARDSI